MSSGGCGACAVKVTSGRVHRSCTGRKRMTPEQEAAGFALLCCTRPQSDVTVETHQARAYRAMRYASSSTAGAAG